MNPEQVEALAEAATDGVEFDGFAVRTEGEGYALTTEAGSGTVVHESDLADAAAEYADYVTNWHFWHARAPQADDRWAFLRWLERAGELRVPDRYERLAGDSAAGDGDENAHGVEGIVRTWGQLRVTVTLDEGNRAEDGDRSGDGDPSDGTRRYDLRHEDDDATPVGDLETYEDPLDARQIAKHDDRGRYRPLKTAPSLRTGWAFPDLGPTELVEAVDFLYPATVANWHRERAGDRREPADGASEEDRPASREGALDVSHWRETVARQSGIYGVVETWDRGEGHEHVNWVAEACCVDSQCLKRREWEYDAETDLDVDGGDGEFPCREPCSLVVAAARQWTKLEGEQSRTYEFELTPSEKEQVEAIVEAVADGRTDEIREADLRNGANRYRVRFLRAKRFDDGDLCGVPTDPSDGHADDGDGGEGDHDGE